MSMTTTEVRFSFLTSGPRFQLELPPDFDRLPSLSTPINNGVGARSFNFHPARIEPDLAGAGRLLTTSTDRDGHAVEVYERLELPQTWWLRWPLANGALTTHLREEDGVDMVDVVIAGLAIVEDASGGTPFLLPDPPLVAEVTADGGYQEFSTFWSANREGWSVRLQRPSFVSPGTVMVLPGSDFAILRAGTESGVEVQVTAGGDLAGGQELLSGVLTSLAAA